MVRDNAYYGRQLWDRWKNEYPFHTITPTTVRPDKTPGTHASVVLQKGFRTWGFKFYDEYQKFAELVTKVARHVANV